MVCGTGCSTLLGLLCLTFGFPRDITNKSMGFAHQQTSLGGLTYSGFEIWFGLVLNHQWSQHTGPECVQRSRVDSATAPELLFEIDQATPSQCVCAGTERQNGLQPWTRALGSKNGWISFWILLVISTETAQCPAGRKPPRCEGHGKYTESLSHQSIGQNSSDIAVLARMEQKRPRHNSESLGPPKAVVQLASNNKWFWVRFCKLKQYGPGMTKMHLNDVK